MKRTLILISALFLMSMGVLAQMNIWRNGVVTHVHQLADVDSITFGALPETPGDAIMLNYKLMEFEGDRYANRGYCYNVIFTTPGTDFEVKEVDLGGQTGYQYVLNRGTAYMIYIISDQLRSQVPEPGTYTIGWYDSDDSEYVQGEEYARRGTFARGYNAAADLPNVDQHAPVGSYKMSKPEEGDYMVDYTDDDIYRYVRGGELEIIENANGSYTWNMTLKFNDLTTEKLTWTGKYEEMEEEPEPELHPSLQGSDYFIFQMDDITYEKIASKVVADFRPDEVANFFYIWENTYAAGTTQGLNFYGEPEGWVSLDVMSVGWSGCGLRISDMELLNRMSAIMEEPENYYFHIAMRSTDNASHLLCLGCTTGSARFCVGESAFVDGGTTYQPMAGLKRDGSWNEIEICMADLLSQGLAYGSNNTNALDVFWVLSGGVSGTNLQFDAAFIYKKSGGEIVEPEFGTVKVVVDAPENTCNGMVAVGTFCNWSPSEGYPFTKVEGSESLYEVTVPYSPDMEFKVIAKTLYDEIDWRYQWGMNRVGEEPNVVLLSTPGCVLDNSENGGEPKLVSFVKGSLTYVEVKSWKTDPCILKNEAGTATWFLTVPVTTPPTAKVSVVGGWESDTEYWTPGAVLMERMLDGRYTLTKNVPANFEYKYVVSADGITWSWDYQCERQFEMPVSLQANDVVPAWHNEPWTTALQYKLTEFEGDRYTNLGYCYNVIFTLPGTDFEVNEVDLGGQSEYQYVLNKGTVYMIYVISDQVRSQVPEPGTYTIGWYDGSDSEYEAGEDYSRCGTFARGYNAAANMLGVDQHAPVGSYKMNKPEEGEYMVDYFDDDVYRYVRDGELEIIENENGTYTWNMTLKFNDLTTEKLTWTGRYIAR